MTVSKKELIAQLGMIAKGIVYSLIGILTALAAFGQGGKQSGGTGSLQYLSQQSYGKVMIVILGIGLLGYVFWRFYQTFANPKNLDGAKGNVKRIAYFISGLIYGFFAYYSLKLAFGSESQSSSGSSGSSFLQGNNADTIVIIVGIGMLIKAGYDLYRAYSGKFREEVEESGMDYKEQKLLINAGKFGHTARGIVIGIMAYLTLSSGLSSGNSIGKQEDAFSFIEQQVGSLGLGVVALGFVGYGVYMFLKAKNPSLSISKS